MRKFNLLLIVFLLFVKNNFAQQLTQTVRGTIADKQSKETLIGASVKREFQN
jgi:hypothetical protein